MTISIEISHRKLIICIIQLAFPVLVGSSCSGVDCRKEHYRNFDHFTDKYIGSFVAFLLLALTELL